MKGRLCCPRATKTPGTETAALYTTGFLALCTLLLSITSFPLQQMHPFALGLGFVFFAFLSALLLFALLFQSKEVNAETLWSAVNVYLTIGLLFAFLFATISYYDEEAFTGRFMGEPLRAQLYGFVYFSFVTLTTLGYGDITPNNTVVGTFTYMEALFGQLYIAILLARLVSLYTAKKG